MKIYLAGGMTVTNVKGRERELSAKFDSWNRLFSFYFMDCIIKSEIIKIIKNENKQIDITKSLRNG